MLTAKLLTHIGYSLKKNAPTIMSITAGVGVVVTSVLSGRATVKANEKIKKHHKETGEPLTKVETVIKVAPAYILPATSAAITILCIFGSNFLNQKRQAAIAGAYIFLDKSFKEYKKKVKEIYGENADEKIEEEIAEDHYEMAPLKKDDSKELFYDLFSKRFFESTKEAVMAAEYHFNRNFILKETIFLNELYDFLGLSQVPYGDCIGWDLYLAGDFYGYKWIDFNHCRKKLKDGREYIVIEYEYSPILVEDAYAIVNAMDHFNVCKLSPEEEDIMVGCADIDDVYRMTGDSFREKNS